jgi:methionyl-tRNA formyltransferase
VLKIFRAKKILEPHHQIPGKTFTDGKTFLRFASSDGWIEVTEIQLEGKKKMMAEEFLRGHRINE